MEDYENENVLCLILEETFFFEIYDSEAQVGTWAKRKVSIKWN